MGTPLCARLKSGGQVELGRIASIEHNKKGVDLAKRGSAVAIKIEPTTAKEASILVGRHFDEKVGWLPPSAPIKVLSDHRTAYRMCCQGCQCGEACCADRSDCLTIVASRVN